MKERRRTEVCEGEKDERGNQMIGTKTNEAKQHCIRCVCT